MDYQSFNEYQQQQRQQLLAEKQRQEAEQLLEKQQAETQQSLREQQRREAEQRIAEQSLVEQQQVLEQQRLKDEIRNSVLGQIAKSLQAANQQTREAQRKVTLKRQEAEQARAKVWIGWDGREFRSPTERAFWDAWKESGRWDEIPLVPQHPISRYRADFADPVSMSIIELDGRSYHTDRYAFTHDRVRERALKKQGWDVLRFSADEVIHGVEGCVNAAYDFISERRNKAR